MSIEQLKSLSRQRWMVPVLAQFCGVRGLRHAVILKALPISRESLSRTLAAAVDAGWILPNAGHGHPLRPEYMLTANGAAVVAMCNAVMGALDQAVLPPASLGRWSLPLIQLLQEGESRFNALERALGEATPRAITMSLKSMAADRLITRTVIDGYPPVTNYGLTATGAILAAALKPRSASTGH